MPEIPDLVVYLDALEKDVVGTRLEGIRLASPFLLRSVEPKPAELQGRRVLGLRRLGKRIALELEGPFFLVIHLMVAGRFRWLEAGAGIPRRLGLAAFDFESGTLLLTEAGSKKRASLHLVAGERGLAAFDRGGLEVLEAGATEFVAAMRRENRTLKRALTDPRILAGIGNAYSDEILHRARLSPVQLTGNLDDQALGRLAACTAKVLGEWIERLRGDAQGGWPKTVTAFREGMAVHGRHREPCPDCGTAVQRIRYAENETNYCPRCQTGGRLLKDRALSQLLKADWPRTIDELESLRG